MEVSSLKIGLTLTALFLLMLGVPQAARSAERPPDIKHGAPIIPWAKSVGEHRYRSPRNYEGTITYYRKTMRGDWRVAWKKIINVSGTRAKHIANRNKAKGKDRWEGINIYEHKGATYIYVVYSDEELKRQADAKAGKGKKKRKKRGR